jgi:hypothetical protein
MNEKPQRGIRFATESSKKRGIRFAGERSDELTPEQAARIMDVVAGMQARIDELEGNGAATSLRRPTAESSAVSLVTPGTVWRDMTGGPMIRPASWRDSQR